MDVRVYRECRQPAQAQDEFSHEDHARPAHKYAAGYLSISHWPDTLQRAGRYMHMQLKCCKAG